MRIRFGLIGTFAVFAVIASFFAATSVAAAPATPPSPLWVNATGVVGTDTSCANPGYTTISAALSAAVSGQVINVCAGTYDEQLIITKAVSLVANGSVTVNGPGTYSGTSTSCDADGPDNQDEVDICVNGAVSISGFTINGGFAEAYCNDDFYGVAVLGGATLTLSNSIIEGVGGPNGGGCQGGVGIQVGEATGPTTADAGHATLTSDTVETYQKNGITVDGGGSTATITDVTVVGAGPAPIAQNGIQISDGAKATITGADVTGNECDETAVPACGPNPDEDTQSIGILLYDAGTTTVKNSTSSNNDIGIYNFGDDATSYYTPPSPFNIVETFTNVTMSNRYENACADAGKTVVNDSHMSGGATGLSVFQYDGQPIGATFTGTGDTFNGASTAAVNIDSDGTSGDFPVSFTLTKSNLNSTNAAGVLNNTSAGDDVVNATDDWWSNASGPSVWSFGTGLKVTQNVNFFPWAVTSEVNSFKSCTTGTNESTSGNDIVLCAKGTGADTLTNAGNGSVLLIGNSGADHLNGSATGVTYIIAGQGHNVINGHGGHGWIQLRGNTHDTVTNDGAYTVAP
jgi:hypothetical protein